MVEKLFAKQILIFTLCTIPSCRPPGFEIGGGGSTHIPPERIMVGKPTTLKLELSVWGEGTGKISNRFKDVRCHYIVQGEPNFITIPMTIESEQKTRVFFVCTIPPQTKQGSRLEYYLDYLFDGHYNKREEKSIPIVISDGNSLPN